MDKMDNTDKLSLKELKKIARENPSYELLEALKNDKRKGAATIVRWLEQYLDELLQKKKKTREMYLFEEIMAPEKEIIAGVDEAGRGPLAGPIVGAAVVLDKKKNWMWLEDSKGLKKSEREEIYQEIKEKALDYSLGIVNVKKIDDLNILNANMLAQKKALDKLKIQPEYILFDGNNIPGGYEKKGEAIVKGDKKAASIAAAGIVAKVVRDKIMAHLHNKFPEYGFYNNKGYPTRGHYKALKEYGPTPVHRRSFLKGQGE